MSFFFAGSVLIILAVIGVVADMFLEFSMRGVTIITGIGVVGALCFLAALLSL